MMRICGHQQLAQAQETEIQRLKDKLRKLGLYAARARKGPQIVVLMSHGLNVEMRYEKRTVGMHSAVVRIDVTKREGLTIRDVAENAAPQEGNLNPLSVHCPHCCSPEGVPCKTMNGEEVEPHMSRVDQMWRTKR